jgi:hypothetical protein
VAAAAATDANNVMNQAFGSWSERDEDSVEYVDRLRSGSRWRGLYPETDQ